MKKLILVVALFGMLLVGFGTSANAGVSVGFGFGLAPAPVVVPPPETRWSRVPSVPGQ